ncbi:MAG: sugar ABC transporter permease, partial [Alcaligenaceae bacterium]|nr:sugar ABC transporter permease [Alcaligenaceae bacterium]
MSTSTSTPHWGLGQSRRDTLLAAGMVLPAILYIVILLGIPIALAFYYSVSDVTTGGVTSTFVGLENFRDLLSSRDFIQAAINTTVITTVTLVATLVLSTIQAELLLRPFPFKWIVRFLILQPWTAPASLAIIGWLWMLDSTFSPYDWLLRQAGLLGSPDALLGPFQNMFWLGRPGLAMFSIILVNVWRLLPLATVIVLAGLNGVPNDIYE